MFSSFSIVPDNLTACTQAEWNTDPDGCEIRNLQIGPVSTPQPQTVAEPVPGLTGGALYATNAAQLAAQIAARGGVLEVWSADVKNSPELVIAAANPGQFAVKAVAGDPGTYAITLKTASPLTSIVSALTPKPKVPGAPPSTEPLGGLLPYILGGVGLVVVLSMLKK